MARRLKVMPDSPLQIACCLIFDDQNRLLLLRRHTKDLGGGLWATPGGRQEPDEDPLTTALREVKEETGLELKEATYLGTHELRMPHGAVHMQTFHAVVKGDSLIVIDPQEHEAYQWFVMTDLLTAEKLIWGLPTTLLDFKLIEPFEIDPTLADGSCAIWLDPTDSRP